MFQCIPQMQSRVYPDLIGRSCPCSLCLLDYRRRRGFTNVFLVRFDPDGGYFALGGLEMQFAGAYELVEFPLKRMFDIRVPGRSFGWLRPKVTIELDPPNDS